MRADSISLRASVLMFKKLLGDVLVFLHQWLCGKNDGIGRLSVIIVDTGIVNDKSLCSSQGIAYNEVEFYSCSLSGGKEGNPWRCGH